MITVRNRTLIIPEGERVIGTDYDSSSEVRHFGIERAPGGIDISHLAFRVDLQYEGKIYDTCMLERIECYSSIVLTWNIAATNVAHPGTVWISLRGVDENGTVKWGTDKAPVYVRGSVNTPANVGITEFEQYEKKVEDALKKMDETKSAADQATERANAAVQEAEKSIEGASKSATSAAGMADLSEAWAHGKTGYQDNDKDNSKYWSDQSKSRAEAAKTSAEDAKNEADRAAGYAESVSPLEDKGLYVPGTEYGKNDLVRYNNDLYRCKNDGVSSTPSEGSDWGLFLHSPATLADMTGTDVQGLLGSAEATGVNAQLLIDAIADKVATKLLLKSDVTSQIINDATKAASAAAVYALQQRIGTGDLPSGMNDIISGLVALNSNMNALTDSSISIPSGSPVTGNRANAKIYQNSFLVLSGEVSIDFTNLKNWNGYNILQCANSSRYNINFIATDENGGSFHMQIDTNGIIKLTIRGYLPENKSQILRFFCIAPLMPA